MISLQTNLISYWKFDETTGNAADIVGGKTLTNSGGAWDSGGKINYCWLGDGNNDILSNTSVNYGSKSAFTVSIWFKYTETTRGDLIDIFKSDNSAAFQMMSNQLSTGGSTGRMSCNLYYSSANHFVDCSVTNLNDGVWHNMIYTLSGTTQTIYLDGAAAGTASGGAAMSLDKFGVGGDVVNVTNYINGYLDELGLWDRALSATEAAQVYNHKAGIQFPLCPSNFLIFN